MASSQDSLSKWDKFWDYLYERFELIPDIHMEADMSGFAFYKNSEFEQRYLLESNTNLDISLVGFKNFLFFNCGIEFQTVMGRNQGENVFFDPTEINYGIVPFLEFNLKPINLQLGVNHHCFHEIDQKVDPTVYWNLVFIAAGSKNMRQADYWDALKTDKGWLWKNRYSWFISSGFYVTKFGGIIKKSTLNGYNDKKFEMTCQGRFTPFHSRYWLYSVVGETMIGTWRNDSLTDGDAELFWQQRLGIEFLLRKGKRGSLVFADLFFDEVPIVANRNRFSKDRLLQIGFRFFI